MKRQFFSTLLTMAFAAMALSAHGDKKHVLGTIERINPASITVKTREGKSVEVQLVSSTMFISHGAGADKPATASELAVGENVVIHAASNGDQLEAEEIKFSAAGHSRTASPKSHP
jgi:hypothetical protein